MRTVPLQFACASIRTCAAPISARCTSLTRHTAVADKCDEGYIYAFRYEPRDRRYIDLVPVDGGQLASE